MVPTVNLNFAVEAVKDYLFCLMFKNSAIARIFLESTESTKDRTEAGGRVGALGDAGAVFDPTPHIHESFVVNQLSIQLGF
jgi:hypothetical protein